MSAGPPDLGTCPACGARLPAEALAGQCPKCLFRLALGGMPDAQSPAPVGLAGDPRFGDYRLLRQIGRGGMGVVYEARHVRLHRTVALKLILDGGMASPVTRRRFAIEAEAAARLDHPHIVPIYELGEQDGQPFLSMKLVAGESLRRKIARGEFRPAGGVNGRSPARCRQAAIAQLIATVARAVDHAHQRGVLHRDLKPGNVLIDGEGQPFVTDFGLAKFTDVPAGESPPPPLTISGTMIGTPDYMSPEQARGGPISAASDIYSLGAILYELLVGRPPFHAATPVETLRSVIEAPPPRPRAVERSIERELETVCLKCLEKDPRRRYRTAAAVADDLDHWLRREPIQARPAGPLLHAARWTCRNPVVTALILSLGFGLALALHLLDRAQRQEAEIEGRRAVILQQVEIGIEAELRGTNNNAIPIKSEILSILDNYRQPDDLLGTPRRFNVMFSPTESPIQVARAYVPFLKRLEQDMARRLDRPVLLDFVLGREFRPAHEQLLSGQTHFQRMGLVSYLLAKQLEPGLQLIAEEDAGKRAVIFVRRELFDRGVDKLARLAGHSFAFGDTNSTINLVAKVLLARAGVRGADLTRYSHFNAYDAETLDLIRSVQRRTGQTDVMPVVRRNRETLRAVLQGGYDAGVVRERYFETEKRKGLIALEAFETPPDVYVARAGLDAAEVEACRESLLALQDRQLLASLPLPGVTITRFVTPNTAAHEAWARAMTNEAAAFEPPSNQPAP